MKHIITILGSGIGYILGIIITITILNLKQKFKDWNRERWRIPKE